MERSAQGDEQANIDVFSMQVPVSFSETNSSSTGRQFDISKYNITRNRDRSGNTNKTQETTDDSTTGGSYKRNITEGETNDTQKAQNRPTPGSTDEQPPSSDGQRKSMESDFMNWLGDVLGITDLMQLRSTDLG